jgi:hypothetical protein
MTKARAMLVLPLLLAGIELRAQTQEPQPRVERKMDVTILRGPGQPGVALGLLPPPPDFDFVTMPLAFEGEAVMGAPYSGEMVTEVVQPLADGNRIVRQSHAWVYRDGEGRTRRELGLAVIGNAVGGRDRKDVQIVDPQSHTNYLLDMDQRTAKVIGSPKIVISTDGAGAAESRGRVMIQTDDTFNVRVPEPPGGAGNAMFIRRTATAALPPEQVEQLGTRSIEGVEAQGTRSTMVIPAGQIGNEQPINVVTERWYSPQLKVLIMSRTSDPRFGETTYRLTNVTRAEPSPELFQVPSDFKIVESSVMPRVFKSEKK